MKVNNRLASVLISGDPLLWVEELTFDENYFNKQNGTVKLEIKGWSEFLSKHNRGRHEQLVAKVQFTDGNSLTLSLWLDGALPQGSGTVKVQVHPPE